MAMFPNSGVPPSDAKNSLPDVNTAGCDELWYSTSRCQPRFDPAAANAMLAEDMNLIMRGELVYDCVRLDHIERAVRYIVQRGLPCGTVLYGGPFDYSFTLNPPITRYNDHMTLVVVPTVNNQSAVRLDSGGLGWRQLLRNDGQQLQAADLRANVPSVISYWGGNWYHVGLCASQVPIVVQGAVDIWIRTDGNDDTGDGSANDPSKAFRTIAGAWNRVGSRYAATPLFTMNFKLGIPGTYQGASLGPFGGKVTLSSPNPPADKTGYRISSFDMGNSIWGNFRLGGLAIDLLGLTLVRDVPSPLAATILRCAAGAQVVIDNIDFDSTVGNAGSSAFILLETGSSLGLTRGTYTFNGRGLPAGSIIDSSGGSEFVGCYNIVGATMVFNDIPAIASLRANKLGIIGFQVTDLVSNNCTGSRYQVGGNSIIYLNGETPPGSTPGTAASGGQVIP